MLTIYTHIIGVIYFTIGVFILGKRIRKNPDKSYAEKQSRIMHFLFHSGLTFPAALSFFYPGLKEFDKLLGFNSFSNIYILIAGIIILVAGAYFILNAIGGLGKQGNGAPAFKLTEKIARKGVYEMVRNPMSLGHYLLYIGISLIAGSTYLILGSVLFVIPAHIFHLKYFEEFELELRYGEQYIIYKKEVPFLFPRVNNLLKTNRSY
ncbi:MAG: hypothetical protein JSV22_06695 [Bacteroidales bacterium]|nr:MAG: hypothetical protein JSV22_06695 [Bacteroidales bacterium]